MKKKVLITDSVHQLLIDKFEIAGYECHYYTHYTNKEVLETIHIYNGIIINSKININKELLDKAIKLEFVGRLGSGMEIIDTEYADLKGVKYYNSPEGNRDSVAEHAIGMLLALFNNLIRSDAEVRQEIWDREKNRGIELMGKTVALIGYGNTGKAMAKKLSGFDVRILAYDKYLENYSDQYVKESTMNEIFDQADIVSFHLPLTKETSGLVNQEFIARFKKNIFIVNTSRGKVLDTNSLLSGLNSGKILGACLDVFENENPKNYTQEEKISFSQLFNHKKVILSPHIAGWTIESKEKLAQALINKILIKH